MTDLLSQLEAATEGSRKLSDEMLLAHGWRPYEVGRFMGPIYYWHGPNGESVSEERRPDPSRNLQDAVSLVPEGSGWSVEVDIHEASARIAVPFEDHGQRFISSDQTFRSDAKTPSLALCIAIIKAHESKGSPVKLPEIRRIAEADDGALEGDL